VKRKRQSRGDDWLTAAGIAALLLAGLFFALAWIIAGKSYP
jgi:hypothetical protein